MRKSAHWVVSTISGAAGGITGEAEVNLRIETLADTVDEIRENVAAVPELIAALKLALVMHPNNVTFQQALTKAGVA